MRSVVLLGLSMLLAGCVEPVRTAPGALTPSSPSQESQESPLPSPKAALPRPAPRVDFDALFLRPAELREGMRSNTTPAESHLSRASGHFACYSTREPPAGAKSGFAEWGDPDGREALWRVLDFRWLFVDDDAGETFRLKTITFYENKKWTVTPCETAMGVVCSRFQTSEERPDGTAHTELGYVFRIGHVVALVVGGEGPRVGTDRIRDGLVMPFARRAATRIEAAFDGAADPTNR